MLVGENLPRHSSDRWRRGYRQHTNAFRQFLLHAPGLSRTLHTVALRHLIFFKSNMDRSNGPGPHSADQVRVERKLFGGMRGDRMEYRVVAHNQKNYKKTQETLKKSLVYVSGNKKISRGGKVT